MLKVGGSLDDPEKDVKAQPGWERHLPRGADSCGVSLSGQIKEDNQVEGKLDEESICTDQGGVSKPKQGAEDIHKKGKLAWDVGALAG